MKEFLARAEFADRLPAWHPSDNEDQFPREMVGATITRIGSLADANLLEGGGLVVEYVTKSSKKARRVVLALTELGAWVEFLGDAEQTHQETDSIQALQ